jgi:hypothetical protein
MSNLAWCWPLCAVLPAPGRSSSLSAGACGATGLGAGEASGASGVKLHSFREDGRCRVYLAVGRQKLGYPPAGELGPVYRLAPR